MDSYREGRQVAQNIENLAQKRFIYSSGCLYELTKWIVVVIIFFTMIHFFVATFYIVDGESMEPNFQNGEYIIVNRWLYNFGKPERGDVVVLKFPGDPEHKKYIKRITGLPGEKVQIFEGMVYINGKKLNEKSYIPPNFQTLPNVNRVLGDDEYFLLGDNRPNSSDSRVWGTAPKRYLIGRTWLVIWPKLEKINPLKY